MQAQEEHAESVPLRFLECVEEVRAAEKDQRSDIIERVQKRDGARDQNEADHQPGPGLVHTAEQAIKSHAETDENDRREQISDNAEMEKCFVSQNIICGRRGIPAHDQLGGNIYEAERTREYE